MVVIDVSMNHYQRTYEEETYKSLLKEIGFTKIETFTDFNLET